MSSALKVYIQTWGCQMNVADSERMLALLKYTGYTKVDHELEADFIVLNTCHIREKADHKLYSRLGELKILKDKNPSLMIAVSGCVAQAEAKRLAQDLPYIDLIFGPDQIEKLPQLIEAAILKDEAERMTQAKHKNRPLVDTKFDDKNIGYSIPIDVVGPYCAQETSDVSRYVNIIKGCNNFCTFCVVPHTRGREKSRPIEEILQEVRLLTAKGAREISLLGQNVNSYGLDFLGVENVAQAGGKMPFADLLHAVAALPNVWRLRFTTSNPHDFSDAITNAFAQLPNLSNAFHLPVQSGSTEVLARMNRQYSRELYLQRVHDLRVVRPNIALSTDIIVGFPGETEAQFEETLSLVEQVKYAFIYAFSYSARRGTAAARFVDQVPEDVQARRLQTLQNFQKEETLRQNQAEIGSTREVLVVYKNKKEETSWYGRTFEGRLVKVLDGEKTIKGQVVQVKILDANTTVLVGICV